jgi:hypothetical protein
VPHSFSVLSASHRFALFLTLSRTLRGLSCRAMCDGDARNAIRRRGGSHSLRAHRWERGSDLCRVNVRPIAPGTTGYHRTSSVSWMYRSTPVSSSTEPAPASPFARSCRPEGDPRSEGPTVGRDGARSSRELRRLRTRISSRPSLPGARSRLARRSQHVGGGSVRHAHHDRSRGPVRRRTCTRPRIGAHTGGWRRGGPVLLNRPLPPHRRWSSGWTRGDLPKQRTHLRLRLQNRVQHRPGLSARRLHR